MQPHSISVKLDDESIDAFALGHIVGRSQQLPLLFNLFVDFYARLAHSRIQ